MERFTISLDESLARQFDELIKSRGYLNRSEAIRDLLREQIEAQRIQNAEASDCVASLSYVYNHHERDLASRLTGLQHDGHHLNVSTMHVHLNHEDCLETVVLRGSTAEVRAFSDSVIAERGVRHGQLNLIPVSLEEARHVHGAHSHLHSHPNT
ncbi:MAG: nickel-responsive transcriptional regulator NikR [Sulfuricella sp.]|nr:nickel-responsive transcriptional regulator NikR [Sulfuricella sp.]